MIRCPKCHTKISVKTPKKVTHGDWIRDPVKYNQYWSDFPVEVRIAIEDHLYLRNQDDKIYTLNHTAVHNKADWPLVKKAWAGLVRKKLIVH